MKRSTIIGWSFGIGALAALLFAPRSGRDSRDLLRDRVSGLTGQARDRLTKGRLRVTEFVQSGQDLADQLLERARPAREAGERRFGELAERARQAGPAAQGAAERLKAEVDQRLAALEQDAEHLPNLTTTDLEDHLP